MKKKLSLILVSIMLIVSCCAALVGCSPEPYTGEVYGLLGEPAVTASVVGKGLTNCIDIQNLYKDATTTEENAQGYGYPQAVVIVKSSYLRDNEANVAKVINALNENVTYINTDANKANITNILQKNTYGAASQSKFPKPAIAKCGVKILTGDVAKTETTTLLKNLGMKAVPPAFFKEVNTATTTAAKVNTLKMAVPDGAPALSVAKIVKDGLPGITLTLDINKPNLIVPQVAGQNLDMAILPTNVALKKGFVDLKDTNDPYVMIATATYGNLYIVGTKATTNIQDLKGKVVYCIGKDAIPHKVFDYVAKANNLELNIIESTSDKSLVDANKINVIFKADGSEVIGAVAATLPQ